MRVPERFRAMDLPMAALDALFLYGLETPIAVCRMLVCRSARTTFLSAPAQGVLRAAVGPVRQVAGSADAPYRSLTSLGQWFRRTETEVGPDLPRAA